MRSKVEPMKKVAKLILNHFDGIIAWSQTRQTNGFLEALNGLFQSARRKARGYGRFSTIRRDLPDRRQTRLPEAQPACGALAHPEFKRAGNYDLRADTKSWGSGIECPGTLAGS